MLAATSPNPGARSLACGSTFQPLMKDHRNAVTDSGEERSSPPSLLPGGGARISLTLKPPLKTAGVCHRETLMIAFAVLHESEARSLDPGNMLSKALNGLCFFIVSIEDHQQSGHGQ